MMRYVVYTYIYMINLKIPNSQFSTPKKVGGRLNRFIYIIYPTIIKHSLGKCTIDKWLSYSHSFGLCEI